MAKTYSGDPSKSNRDRIRFEVGDTIMEKALLSDEEIDALFVAEGSNVYRTCARLCEGLAARFSRDEIVRTGSYSTERGGISGRYEALAKVFRAKAVTSAGFRIPSLSEATKETHEEDTDIPQPSFYREMHENIGSAEDEKASDW